MLLCLCNTSFFEITSTMQSSDQSSHITSVVEVDSNKRAHNEPERERRERESIFDEQQSKRSASDTRMKKARMSRSISSIFGHALILLLALMACLPCCTVSGSDEVTPLLSNNIVVEHGSCDHPGHDHHHGDEDHHHEHDIHEHQHHDHVPATDASRIPQQQVS